MTVQQVRYMNVAKIETAGDSYAKVTARFEADDEVIRYAVKRYEAPRIGERLTVTIEGEVN